MSNFVKIPVIEFVRPNGQQIKRMITVTKEQAAFFQENNIKLSTEDLGNGYYALYADTGKKNEDGDPEETTMIVAITTTINTAIGRMINKIKAKTGV